MGPDREHTTRPPWVFLPLFRDPCRGASILATNRILERHLPLTARLQFPFLDDGMDHPVAMLLAPGKAGHRNTVADYALLGRRLANGTPRLPIIVRVRAASNRARCSSLRVPHNMTTSYASIRRIARRMGEALLLPQASCFSGHRQAGWHVVATA